MEGRDREKRKKKNGEINSFNWLHVAKAREEKEGTARAAGQRSITEETQMLNCRHCCWRQEKTRG